MDIVSLVSLINCTMLLIGIALWTLLFIYTVYISLISPILYPQNGLCHHTPVISVLLPVRNEASRVLRKSIQSLAEQTYPYLEIIIVDDNSTDNSLEILQDITKHCNRIKVIRGEKTPKGWTGKSYALHQAKQASSGDWLLFADADVDYSRNAIATAWQYVIDHDLDALSLLSKIEMRSFWEEVILPVIGWLTIIYKVQYKPTVVIRVQP